MRMDLLNRIANYFKEWDGVEETAPKMELNIKELRYVADMNVEICKLKAENKALKDKQTPKKPTLDGDGYAPDGTFIWDEWLCPNCNTRYEVDYDEYDYCPNCGQHIDRSDLE